MMNAINRIVRFLTMCITATVALTGSAAAHSKNLLTQDAEALQALYKTHPGAKTLGTQAAGILVFPKIVAPATSLAARGRSVLFKKEKAHSILQLRQRLGRACRRVSSRSATRCSS